MEDTGFLFVPEHIMERDDLLLQEKCVYGRIIGLTKAYGYCDASNEWLGRKLGMSTDMVSKYISRLASKNLLIVEVNKVKKEDSQNPNEWGTKRKIFAFLPQDSDGYRVKTERGTDFTPSIVIQKENTVSNTEDDPLKEYKEGKQRAAQRRGRRLGAKTPPQYTSPYKKFEKKNKGFINAEGVR